MGSPGWLLSCCTALGGIPNTWNTFLLLVYGAKMKQLPQGYCVNGRCTQDNPFIKALSTPLKNLGTPTASLRPGSAGLGWQAMHSLPRAQKITFFGSFCTQNALQPPCLCSPNPSFVLLNQLRLCPDVITLRRYFPHMNVVSYPSGIKTHFSFQEQASVACSWADVRAAGAFARASADPRAMQLSTATQALLWSWCTDGLTRLQSRHRNTSPAGLRKAWKRQINQSLSWERGSPARAEGRGGQGSLPRRPVAVVLVSAP